MQLKDIVSEFKLFAEQQVESCQPAYTKFFDQFPNPLTLDYGKARSEFVKVLGEKSIELINKYKDEIYAGDIEKALFKEIVKFHKIYEHKYEPKSNV
jgi:hypothetical protein